DDFELSRVQEISKDSKIVVYCSVGYRSEKIAEKLQGAGYTDVSNLYGGIFEWVNQDRAVVDDQNTPTTKVHAFSRVWGVWLNKGEKVY
ncbi:MAG: rhodanese-like domain-containing protein, partial [Candidatus Kapaibacterium sp.]